MIKISVSEYQAIRDKYFETKGFKPSEREMEIFGVGFIQALNFLYKNHQLETEIVLEEK